ncbi:glucan biosynthesis protein [Carnimonas bestiolae]|uniref:glucan biosynthesis protein n=1 Tax=Carnimonas bestiolae TaxID=3402172 RepID=UPI003EDC99B5
MDRRSVLKASAALAAFCSVPSVARAAAATAPAAIADGKPTPFSFDELKKRAKSEAAKPFGGAPGPIPETLAKLSPLQYQKIGYDKNHALWHANANRAVDVEFFHVGMNFKRRVHIYSLNQAGNQAREVHFRPSLFNYHDAGVDTNALKGQDDLGFAGFKVFRAPDFGKSDVFSFLGASYFRAEGGDGQYGLSARGLAIDTYIDDLREEFPDFVAFWIQQPSPANSQSFSVYALLDSPSAVGAYHFVLDCENVEGKVTQEVDSFIYPRKDIAQLGIAPMSSMFSCGSNDRRACLTYHPEIHDSDRLALWRGNGEWIARPLNNPEHIQFNAFADENPRGFGLLQLQRDFATYQDTVDLYHKRPSLWVEPLNQWGKGAVNLLELPSTGETLDNIVCMWQPEQKITKGGEYHFRYRLHWAPLPPVKSSLANVLETRQGAGGFTEGWAPGEQYPDVWCRRFAVDFAELKEGLSLQPQISVSGGKVQDVQVIYVKEFKGYRILFDWYPTSESTDPIDLRLFLKSGNDTLSETWLYQYFPPAASERRYPTWPADKK